MPEKPLNVIICGGSLGGLFAGVVLKRSGHNVRIFERNPTELLQSQGAGVVDGGDLQSYLGKYDLTHAPYGVVSHLRHYLDKEGHEIRGQENDSPMTSWDLLYNRLRANFDGEKSEYCVVPEPQDGEGRASYETAHTVLNVIKKDSRRLEVTYRGQDGKEATTIADLVIGADGPGSTIRSLFDPVSRKYVGYVAWRGTVIEDEISEAAKEAFVEKFSFFYTQSMHILAYVIPGRKGALEPGKRLVNYVWYCNYPEGSDEFKDLMTDKNGKVKALTIHAGLLRQEIWERQKEYASKMLPPQFAELVLKTKEPSVQVLLMGDAVAGFRPHTAASTSQAAFDALMLDELISGRIDGRTWERETMQYAREVQSCAVEMGQTSQYGPFSSGQIVRLGASYAGCRAHRMA